MKYVHKKVLSIKVCEMSPLDKTKLMPKLEEKAILGIKMMKNGILLPKLFWPTVWKNCSTDREKLLKFKLKAEN